MNETRKAPIKDPGQKRREYLRKIGIANTFESVGATVALLFGSIFVFLSMVFLLANGLETDWEGKSEDSQRSVVNSEWITTENSQNGTPAGMAMGKLAAAAIFFSFTGAPAFCGLMLWQAAAKKARSIPYVPPVREQIAALPAEQILVRGSEEPDVLPQDMLRAALLESEKPEEELLRSVVG